MKRAEWIKELGELVRDAMRSPELDHYFKVKITKPGAQVLITQLGLLFTTGAIAGRMCRATVRTCR